MALNLWRFAVELHDTGRPRSRVRPCFPSRAYTAALQLVLRAAAGHHQMLDALGDRLMYRLSYRNLGPRIAGGEPLVPSGSVDEHPLVRD